MKRCLATWSPLHRWGIWEISNNVVFKSLFSDRTAPLQERRCSKCGLRQTREL